MSFFTRSTDATYNKLDVSKISVNKSLTNPTTGIIDTDKLNATTEIETDTVYCKSLVVLDNLYIPVENMPNITQKTVTINRIAGAKQLNINSNMGKLSYDGILKDLKSTTDTGDKRSVTDTFNSVTNNSRFKENILLKGWSFNDGGRTVLYQPNGNEIDVEEHVYYQGCGYIVGFRNPSVDQVMSTEETIVVPPTTEIVVTPASTTYIDHAEIQNTIPIPGSYTITNEIYIKYQNIVNNPYFNVPDNEIREFQSYGNGDNLAFDSYNNCYKIQYMSQNITLIKSTGEITNNWLSGQYYYSIAIDSNDVLWINSLSPTKGLYKIVTNNGVIESNDLYIDFNNASTEITEDIRNLGINSNGDLFMLTANNIYKISTTLSNFELYYSTTGESDPRAICFNGNDIIYSGRIGKKIYKLTEDDGIVTRQFYAGISATIGSIFGLAIKDHILYISDTDAHVVRKISSEGTISIFAGNGISNGAIDSSYNPVLSSIVSPAGMVFDKYGDLYVTQTPYPTTSTDHIKVIGFNTLLWQNTSGTKLINKIVNNLGDSPNFTAILDNIVLFKSVNQIECYNFTFDSNDNIYTVSYTHLTLPTTPYV